MQQTAKPSYANLLGFYTAVLTAFLTVFTFGIAFLTPPLTGPLCRADCIDYPFTEMISRFPRDYYWMCPTMVLTMIYLVLMICIYHYAPDEKKIFGQIGVAFALFSTIVLITDYFVQVSVIQPSIENGETDGIALLSQYNPHGVFIALEEVGYLMMSVAFLAMAPIFSGANRLEKALRWIFIGNFALAVMALVLYTISYGIFREYRFEIAAISINWLTLIVGGILLSRVFKKG